MKKTKGMHVALVAMSLLCTTMARAEDVKEFRYMGPYPIHTPWMGDSVDIQCKKFDLVSLLETPLRASSRMQEQRVKGNALAPGSSTVEALHQVSFIVENEQRAKVTFRVGGLHHYCVMVDGQKADVSKGALTLLPSIHRVTVQYLTSKEWTDSLRVQVEADGGIPLRLGLGATEEKRSYDMYDVICTPSYRKVGLSYNGRYLLSRKEWTDRVGGTHSQTEVRDIASKRLVGIWNEDVAWMPLQNKLYTVRREAGKGTRIVLIDPSTHEETIWADAVPDGWFTITPDERSLVYTLEVGGRKRDAEVYDVREPEDRQPGWRTRTNLALYDLSTGVLQPLTFGYHNIVLHDISADSHYLLFSQMHSRLEKRPTTLYSFYRMNLQTASVDTLVSSDGFLSTAQFSPDGREVLFSGSPEAFGGIGKNVDEGQTPSMTDGQLFLLNIASRQVRPLTHQFDPSVLEAQWSRYDGQVYLKAEDKDFIRLFRLNPKDERVVRLDLPEECVNDFSLACDAPAMAMSGQSASNADRLYSYDTKTKKMTCQYDIHAHELADVRLGECHAWNWVNEHGDTICCRYYLPPNFDAQKKYPVVVNYYGGCSPTSRTFASRYPQHVYASMGYIVLVVNPSGATGFGQRFSARHVATAGEGVAEDIIGSTRAFLSGHPYADARKVGCIGASYGGFMTQYLQTKTDLFAAAISHAGISDHTSYWGEGYWGYSYSEVSMADHYPWTDKHLYVDQSPLYNADKIHTPLLFLHGTADNNVPVGESIQLYTALKLLGRPTAMVLVDGQDHHIIDFRKRLKWQDTIFAWFAKWLQDDDTWWTELYGDEKM